MRLVVGAVILLLLTAVAYTSWPLINLYQLANAVRSQSPSAFLEHVDLPSVRKSIARQIVDRASKGAIAGVTLSIDPSGQEIAANLLEARLEALITPETVLDLLRRGRTGGDGGAAVLGAVAVPGGGPNPYVLPSNPLSRLKDLGFSAPTKFRISVGEGSNPGDWLALTLALQPRALTWLLSDVHLPDKVFRRLKGDIHIEITGGR